MPKSSGNKILVKVHAVGINPVDYKLNKMFGRLMNNKVICSDFSGEVVDSYKNSNYKVGDKIFGMNKGSLAEYILVNENECNYLKPDNISHEEAASIPLAGQTSLQALRDFGKVNN